MDAIRASKSEQICLYGLWVKCGAEDNALTCIKHTSKLFLTSFMHTESHRFEELRTAVQKLSFGLQILKLYLVIVAHLIGDRRGGIDRIKWSSIRGKCHTSSLTDCTLYRGRILKIEPSEFSL